MLPSPYFLPSTLDPKPPQNLLFPNGAADTCALQCAATTLAQLPFLMRPNDLVRLSVRCLDLSDPNLGCAGAPETPPGPIPRDRQKAIKGHKEALFGRTKVFCSEAYGYGYLSIVRLQLTPRPGSRNAQALLHATLTSDIACTRTPRMTALMRVEKQTQRCPPKFFLSLGGHETPYLYGFQARTSARRT